MPRKHNPLKTLLQESKLRHEAPRGPSHRAGNTPPLDYSFLSPSASKGRYSTPPDQQDRRRAHAKRELEEAAGMYRQEREYDELRRSFRRRVRKRSRVRPWPPGEEPYIHT